MICVTVFLSDEAVFKKNMLNQLTACGSGIHVAPLDPSVCCKSEAIRNLRFCGKTDAENNAAENMSSHPLACAPRKKLMRNIMRKIMRKMCPAIRKLRFRGKKLMRKLCPAKINHVFRGKN
jgi:hypothetical protein